MDSSQSSFDSLTWAMLLAQWTDFAKAAVALPQDGEAGRFRQSVTPIISLAAITHAIGDIDRLHPEERALAVDQSEIQVRQAVTQLDMIWDGEEPPESVWRFVEEAAIALATVSGANDGDDDGASQFEWITTDDGVTFEHPAGLLPVLASLSPTLEVWVPSPGVPFFAGAVICHVADEAGVDEEVLGILAGFLGEGAQGPIPVDVRHQTVRQFDFSRGGPVRDVVVRADMLDADAVPGQPLLVAGVIPDPGGDHATMGAVAMPPRASAPMGVLEVEMLDEEPS